MNDTAISLRKDLEHVQLDYIGKINDLVVPNQTAEKVLASALFNEWISQLSQYSFD
jgi:hypothetical protein